MTKKPFYRLINPIFFVLPALLLTGCVERKLTINTQPQGALVWLNDEEIGATPVTVAFNWYGDYKIRITKDGFQSLNTHRLLKAPAHDSIGLDFIAGVLWPGRIIDEYEWNFDLETYKKPELDELVNAALTMKKKAAGKLR